MKRIISACLLPMIFLLNACSVEMDSRELENKYANELSRFILLGGNRVHVRDEGKGEVIVLIHGTASSLHTWDGWADKLKDDYRVVRMDLPGFGLTGPDHSGRYEVSDDVVFIKALFDELDIEQAHLVGSSLGGRIAWQFALDHSGQVKTLTLMNSLGYLQEKWPPPIEMAQWPVIDEVMKHISPRFMYEIGLKDVYHDPSLVDEHLIDRYFELSRYPGNLGAFPMRVKARLDKDSDSIRKIKVPTLIQWGEEDVYFPVESAYQFEKDIADARLVVYQDVGHLPMEEVPEKSLKDFKNFLGIEGNSKPEQLSYASQ